jgi:glucans biosynthesis protein
VEPIGNWDEGQVNLVEIPTTDETNDNIVAFWTPKNELKPQEPFAFGYRIRAVMNEDGLHPGGKAINTYQASPRALGSSEAASTGRRRFIIDFAGGELAYYLGDPGKVQIVPTATQGAVLRTFLVPNLKTRGFRAGIDVAVEPGRMTDLRAYLRSGNRALTETWTFPWSGS